MLLSQRLICHLLQNANNYYIVNLEKPLITVNVRYRLLFFAKPYVVAWLKSWIRIITHLVLSQIVKKKDSQSTFYITLNIVLGKAYSASNN